METLLQKAFAKKTLLACKGYNPLFIDKITNIGLEKIAPAALVKLLPAVEGNKQGILNYTSLSVLYNTERRVPFVSAYNIDGSAKESVKRTTFKVDPRIDKKIQLTQKGFYDLRKDLTEFEIGHMAANNEMAWGKDAQFQSFQTFHFPNSVPQAENLNTGIWKTLETYIVDEASTIQNNKRICVFTGPILRKEDPGYIKEPAFKIPLLFYKIIVFPTAKGLYTTGFVMSHEQKMIELGMFVPVIIKTGLRSVAKPPEAAFRDFKYKEVFQVNIDFIEGLTGLKFDWKGVKRIPVPNDKNQLKKISDAPSTKAGSGNTRGINMANTETQGNTNSYKLNIILP